MSNGATKDNGERSGLTQPFTKFKIAEGYVGKTKRKRRMRTLPHERNYNFTGKEKGGTNPREDAEGILPLGEKKEEKTHPLRPRLKVRHTYRGGKKFEVSWGQHEENKTSTDLGGEKEKKPTPF